ncbi:hypothetical protein C8Q75DRAFT_810986 [Abortiporus biennis]|nr:hypothetical protein C8Q75DRAFT_810986 [Abortiporus biennis]
MPDTNPTERSSSHLSPVPATPTWAPPKSPLAPHRLAKLANALGVSTPIPVTHSYSLPLSISPSYPNSAASSTFPDLRRSPTPSVGSGQTHTPNNVPTSKYLLHVIPPEDLPIEFADGHELTPPPPSASGYHNQFRRGIMVPVYSSLQLQLWAIAREYALPSTLGMVLYLITSTPATTSEGTDEPGPRISDEIWKHVWTRVLKAERDEAANLGPKSFGLSYSIAGRSSPALLQDIVANSQMSRAITSPNTPSAPYSMTPSPSTPSNSAYSSQSELDTPESASSVSLSGGDSIPLPGLNSSALIPILAKVEFDIDRQRAGWFDNWVRSRRVNHAKRAESRLGVRSKSRMNSESSIDGDDRDGDVGGKKGPIDLALVEKMEKARTIPNFLLTTQAEDVVVSDMEDADIDGGYEQLAESPVDGDDAVDSVDEPTARLDMVVPADPLADVFGSDADTWAEMHAETESQRTSKRQTNPNVVELSLDAASLSRGEDEPKENSGDAEEDEVAELLHRMSRPTLAVTIPDSPSSTNRRRSSPTTSGTIKKRIPPPLDLAPSLPDANELGVPSPLSPMPPNINSSRESIRLAYLADGTTPTEAGDYLATAQNEPPEENDERDKFRSPQDEKRDGTIFDELNLGLDPSLEEGTEFDDDLDDRRRSQYILAAQLDEIEKNLAQFSPRRLKTEDLIAETASPSLSASASNLSPSLTSTRVLRESQKSIAPGETPSWPAVPYSALNRQSLSDEDEDADEADRPPSPPKFAFNGISTEPPKSPFQQRKKRTELMSDESLARQRELEEERGLYPPSLFPQRGNDSPIIPLSPDPFGRYPSEFEEQQDTMIIQAQEPIIQPPDRTSSLSMKTAARERVVSQTAPSSRFSIDSVTSEDAGRTPAKGSAGLMAVKSIRRFWRRGGKNDSISTPPIPESGRSSPNLAVTPTTTAQPPQPQAAARTRSKSISRPPPAPPLNIPEGLHIPSVSHHMPDSMPPPMRYDFDHETRFPRHPNLRPSPIPSRTPSPPAPSPLTARPPSVSHNRPPSISQSQSQSSERNSVRKSILKSWKSATGLATQGKGHSSKASTSSTTTPRSSTEQLPETGRRRRPSVLELGSSRGSISSSSVTLADIPPSPAIPDQFLPQSRSGSRQSQLTLNGSISDKRESLRTRPSTSSTSSPPRVRSPLTAISGSPSQNNLTAAANTRASVESFESRPSFDVSQFEMVSPPRASLTYPYNALDAQSLHSQE